jgi:PAS domain S-box-containing protein
MTQRRARKQPGEAPDILNARGERMDALEKANEDLKAAQAELQRRWQYLAEAQRLSHSGTFGWKVSSGELIWSDETYRILGFTRETHPTLDLVFDRIHPGDRDHMQQLRDRAARNGMDLDVEHRMLLPDSSIRYVHVVAHAGRDNSGNLEYMGVVTDITERKRADQERQALSRDLEKSKARLEEAQRVAHIGHFQWDLIANRMIFSDELHRIFGLHPLEGPIDIELIREMIHPEDRERAFQATEEAIRGGAHVDVEHRIVRPNGDVRYVRCVGVPVVEEGVFKGFHGTTMDVTQHELLTQELRREQAYLAEAQRLTHTGSWASNLVTRQVFHSSEENNRLYGFDLSQYPNPFDLHYSSILAEDEPALTTKLENAIGARADFDVEYRIRRADGAIRFLRGIGHHNPAQEFGDYFGITMDITDRKHAEKEREKLRQLEADLAHINRVNMMGELAAALAHEIKQPIAASITSANALRRWLAHDPPDLERARAAAIRIEQDANRAADVINSLQSFYKRGTPVQRQIVDVKHVIEEMAVLLETEAARHLVAIITEINDNTPNLLLDRVQLQQVFMNLMLNAIEAMQDTGGELTIKSQVNPEGWLIVSMSDTGVGLPEDWSDEIFDPFHSTKPQGTGMGLTITRSIVESYRGRVWATANQGAGATFHFTLPAEPGAHG